MKKICRKHGMNKFIKDFFKIMRERLPVHMTNNYRKMHRKPMRRKKWERRYNYE